MDLLSTNQIIVFTVVNSNYNKWKNILCQNDRYVVMANATKAHKQDVAGEISIRAIMKSQCNNPIPT